ncbi:glycosyltransferase family 2 protein [Methylomonas sp. HYX-M1]|uniref:glycosyltransferase family 2 protein n=1 Tax=Methylomonas sp. HYX-M1 TaxID=3139307 RepID=UPI00345C03EB
MFKPCFLIPVYNHEGPLPAIVRQLARFDLPCILVDDGSATGCAETIQHLAQQYPWVCTIRLPHNLGKGGAVKAGLRHAERQGYSHALQIDADGQHDLQDVPQFLATAQANPAAMVLGRPLFDASIPKARYYGRYLTHAWVYINTLSLDIADAMCGYRVYPLAATAELLRNAALENRMAFDIEILVRLYWQGVPVLSIPTKVGYPADGISHFRGLEDNLRISLTHAKLFFGMLYRLPTLLARHFR